MNTRSIIGIAALIIGAILLLFSMHIQTEVAKGRGELKASHTVTGKFRSFLFSKRVAGDSPGDAIIGYVENQARQSEAKANFYETASYFFIAVAVLFLIAGFYLIFKRV